MILPGDKAMNEIRGTAYARPATTWDPDFGYRWNTGENRVLRVSSGEIVSDRTYSINNCNQHCSFDYTTRKAAANIYRIIVLGDSFTNDIMLHTAWPETLHRLLNSRPEYGIDFEVYSFPTDGGGLVNWHATFMQLIEPDFDYDAVIIADWGDDLARSWAVSECSDSQFQWAYVPPNEAPRTRQEAEAMLADGQVIAEITDNDAIEDLVQRLKQGADPKPMTPDDYADAGCGGCKRAPDGYAFSKETFIERYDAERYGMLKEIVDTCKQKGKQVVYSPIPTREGLIDLKQNGGKLMAQVQGEGLARHFDVRYFDGFAAFSTIDNQALIDFYWLKYDGHWNLGASMHYALKLASWIFETKFFLQR